MHYIPDFLCDDLDAFEKQNPHPVPCNRDHLSKCVEFKYSEDFGEWKEEFPDRVNPPAIHTRSLFFHHADHLIGVDVRWIRSFTDVVQLEVAACWDHDHYRRPFAPFHGLSSTVKSLSMVWRDLPSSDVFPFICSFSHLVDLHVAGKGQVQNIGGDWTISPLPPLTGSIVLGTSTSDFVHQLLKQPNNLHFKKIVWQKLPKKSFEGVADLVEKCSGVLECIEIDFGMSAESLPYTPAISPVSICRTSG